MVLRMAIAIVMVPLVVQPGCRDVEVSQNDGDRRNGSNARMTTIQVETYGALRQIMHDGDVSAKVAMSEVLPGPGTYGIGTLSELRGEVTIINDTAWLSYPKGTDSVETVHAPPSDDDAALLVTARVHEWRSVPVTHHLELMELDSTVAALALASGLDTSQPFPFLLSGTFPELQWHVIDGARLEPGPSTHEAHQQASVHGTKRDFTGTILGFFSTHHQGVFTHHDAYTHLHVVLPDRSLSAHVDHLSFGDQTVLLLPN